MTRDDVIKHWMEGAEDALETADALFDAEKYHFALFFCHLTLEKVLKAKVVKKTNKPAPYIHDLLLLAKQADINFSESDRKKLREINTFNIKTRYTDYKKKFYIKATKSYADHWFQVSKDLLIWLEKK